jgi:hypothetical protein
LRAWQAHHRLSAHLLMRCMVISTIALFILFTLTAVGEGKCLPRPFPLLSLKSCRSRLPIHCPLLYQRH